MTDLFISLFLSLSAYAAQINETDRLLSSVIERRREVEEVAKNLKAQQEKAHSKIQQVENSLEEMKSQLEGLRLKKLQLEARKEQLEKHVRIHLPESKDMDQLLTKWITRLKASIESSIPFEKKSRVDKVSELEKRKEDKEPALSLLWSLWEMTSEELKLTRGSHYSLYQGEGSPEIVEVVRLGMWRMYEKRQDELFVYENIAGVVQEKKLNFKNKDTEELFHSAKAGRWERVLNLPGGVL